MTIQEQIGQLETMAQNPPGLGVEPLKKQIDDWVQEVMGIAGEGLGGVAEVRSTAEHAKQQLDAAAAALAQLPLDVTGIVQRLSGA